MATKVELTVPQIGESITTAIIGRWLRKPGEPFQVGEPVVELDSDKASLEVPAPIAGAFSEVLAEEGEEVAIGAVIARIDVSAAVAPAAEPEPEPEPEDTEAAPKAAQTGPAARQAAAQLGVDIAAVEGTGTRGRVLRRDVEAVAEPRPSSGPKAGVERVERVPMSHLRRTIARRLVEAQHAAAMLTTFNEIDMSAVFALRRRYQDRFVAKYGHKLGLMPFFVKATIEALKAHPAVNAEIDDSDADRPVIVYKRYYNIGVAVSTERGLMVPVVRDADHLSFAETEQAIRDLATKGRDGKLLPDDFKDGTFTISNGGVFGSLMSTPILNPPQSGILGMHTIQQRPVGVDGEVVLRPMMYVALSYDHRIIDGREAVGFLVRIKELVEAPERILIEV